MAGTEEPMEHDHRLLKEEEEEEEAPHLLPPIRGGGGREIYRVTGENKE